MAYYSREDVIAKRAATSKEWLRLNGDRHRQATIAWQKRNPERVKEIGRKTRTGDRGRHTSATHTAKRRGLTWNISVSQLAFIRANPCVYCSSPLDAYGPGLDRVNNDRGYELDNVVPCCGTCNRIRGDRLTYEEMKAAMSAVLEFRRRNRLTLVAL